MFCDEILHLLFPPTVYGALQTDSLFLCKILYQLVCAETLMAFLTIHQRVRKTAEVAGRHPGLRIHQNRAIHAYIVFILLNKFLPPCLFDIVFQFYTEISIIPCICQPAIYLGTRIDKSAVLCQGNYLLHCLFHGNPPILPNILSLYFTILGRDLQGDIFDRIFRKRHLLFQHGD